MSGFPGERRVSVDAPAPYPHDRRIAERGPLQAPHPAGPRPSAPLPDPSDWTFELIEDYHSAIRATAKRFGLDTYPNQLEIITSEQMMDAYASVGMPVNYRHWSYGKEFISNEKNYKRGQMGLAYEIVINSDPCISYLMEENTTAMQALVIAHAAYGHNSFFKGNYLFKLWTDASSIIDYLVYSKNYIAECEERFGMGAVEELLDSCHALQTYGVDRYRRPSKLSLAEESARRKDRLAHAQSQVNDIWRTLPKRPDRAEDATDAKRFPSEMQENILYFIEKNAPLLEPWQREVVRIVRAHPHAEEEEGQQMAGGPPQHADRWVHWENVRDDPGLGKTGPGSLTASHHRVGGGAASVHSALRCAERFASVMNASESDALRESERNASEAWSDRNASVAMMVRKASVAITVRKASLACIDRNASLACRLRKASLACRERNASLACRERNASLA